MTTRRSSVQCNWFERNDMPVDARPIIGITMGDPSGVGPEVIVKALNHADLPPMRAIVLGDHARLADAARISRTHTRFHVIDSIDAAAWEAGTVEVIQTSTTPAGLPYGQLSAEAGNAAYECVRRAVELAMAGKISAICTAPLNKEALHLAGHRYPGHTELLAELTGTEESMLLMSDKLKVIHPSPRQSNHRRSRKDRRGPGHRVQQRGCRRGRDPRIRNTEG